MATGIPVIASTHAGLPELVLDHDTGLLVPTRNAAALSDAVVTLINQPELASKVSRNGRAMVENEHNVKNQVKQTEDLYDRLIR
jgi:glycosyltransferase involved in cell wall biosynthesis